MSSVRNVVFVAPFPMQTTLAFVRAVCQLDRVRVVLVCVQPPPRPSELGVDSVIRVRDALDVGELEATVRKVQQTRGPVHRLLGVLENLQLQLAVVRERLGIEGPSPEVTRRFRDKGHMKDALRAAGLPCARHARIQAARDAWAFVEQVGFPVVLKPPAGAGCKATMRGSSPQELVAALRELQPGPGRTVLAEEFLTGAEYSFETVTVGGEPRFWSITRYYPNPLEVTERNWIQWCVVLPAEVDTPLFRRARDMGLATVRALGLRDGITHMEWFHRPDGSLAIGEIAARPPGARIVELTSRAHGFDMKRAWARAVVDGAFDGPWSRRGAVGVAFLRGQGTGRVASVTGLDAAQAKMGDLVVNRQLPKIGQPRSDSYEGEGWVVVAHPQTARVREALFELITSVKVTYAAR